MQAAIFSLVPYAGPTAPGHWPFPAQTYSTETAERSMQASLEQFELADQVGFDWVTVAEHHYAPLSLTPNPMIMAGALTQRVRHAKIALLGADIPILNPIRVAEEFAMFDLDALVLAVPAAIRPESVQRSNVPPEDRLGLLYAHPERQAPRPRPDPAIIAKQEALLGRLGGPPRDSELEARLPELNVPTLVLFGTLDRSISPEMGRVYRELLPNCHLVLVYDAGHALDMDRPEAFASVVEDFLRRREGFIVTSQSALIYP
jgi:pimeloyl-ACP methyl ester carboxylesterase